ncbi:MAG: DUF4190 domain-containing protein [Nakamurella sp.]
MSQPGGQDPSTAVVPTADPTADPAHGMQAWDAATPAPTETYPASAPVYPAADPYDQQASSFPPAPQPYGQPGPPQYSQLYQQYGTAQQPAAPHPPPGMVHPQPGAPYVPPGGPHPVGYGYPVRGAPMCGLAVASLVCGIVWVYWITSILAIIFAAVALGKIKREGLRGKGLAIAGLVLGIVWMALLVLGLIGALVGGTRGLVPFTG